MLFRLRPVALFLVAIAALGAPIAASWAAIPSALPAEVLAEVEAGRRDLAVADLTAAVKTDSKDALARYRLALVLAHGSDAALQEAGRQAGVALPEYRLIAQCEYALARGDATRALALASQYSEAYPAGALRDLGQYRLAQCELAAGKASEAEKRFDWLSRNAEQPWRGYGLYGQAQAALQRRDTTEAIRVLRQASRQSHHEISASALLLLGQLFEARGESAEAFRYLSLYREAYPKGMLPLVTATPGADVAETEAGLVYAVQVGVFGQKANAEAQKAKFKALKYSVVLHPKTVGGKQYIAVLVGRYQSREKAQEVRTKLERRFDETYRVVVME